MDKYEYNLKLEEIDNLVDQGDYEQAAALADTIDWRRVRNVRTLCLISEIYEAAGMLDKSKDMLVRAYRKSPVGRTVLYRLVEVTTALGQYDEALEYFSEYVQVAPHDNNRYILKYKIYKGRGSSPEDLIEILEEYLGQEYTERWAYELALNYQQAGQMQKCLATCDDLVLWFHSGKYVKKALDLKKKYAELTPKQQEIYENCLQEEERNEYEEESGALEIEAEGADGDVIAENIIAETEKEIAGAVSARKAEKDTAEEPVDELLEELGELPEGKPVQAAAVKRKVSAASAAKKEPAEPAGEEKPAAAQLRPADAEEKESAESDGEEEPAESAAEEEPAEAAAKEEPLKAAARKMEEEPVELLEDGYEDGYEKGYEMESEAGDYAEDADSDQNDLQVELAKSVRRVISGVGHKPELNEDDVPAAVEDRLRSIQESQTRKEPEPKAAQLSIDDVLLAMSDKGTEAAKAAEAAADLQAAGAAAAGKETRREKKAEETTPAEAEEEEAAPAETKEEEAAPAEAKEKAAAPREQRLRTVAEAITDDLTQEELEALKYSDDPGKFIKNHTPLPVYSSNGDLDGTRVIMNTKEEPQKAARKEQLEAETIRIPTDEVARAYGEGAEEEEASGEKESDQAQAPKIEEVDLSWKEQEAGEMAAAAAAAKSEKAPAKEKKPAKEKQPAKEEEPDEEEEYFDDILTLDASQRGLFPGFTEVDGLEDQIANAILQAMSKGNDRTSRSGNILIFGAHGSGKTTLATGIARAIAQEKGSKVAKMAKIYAADLNRKDIASTIAKIAGGTLIIEEAGDLEDKTVEQLTTAMEFRTDGLIIILEDEQRYVHELLMNHPRFTMKFTAQIYLPDYTLEELLVFGQLHANEQGFKISDEAAEAIGRKVDAAEKTDTPITVGSMIEMVDEAIHRSNKFMRRMTMGKKRYDEDNYILLFEKDFK